MRDLFRKQSVWLQRNRAWVWPLGTEAHVGIQGWRVWEGVLQQRAQRNRQQHWHAALPKPNEELGEVLPSYNLLSADNKDPTWQPVLPGEQRHQCLRCASLWCCRKPELRMLTVEGWMAHQSGKFCNISSYVSWASQTLQGSVYYSTAFSISWNSLV